MPCVADAVEEHELLELDEADHDQARFLAGETPRSCSPRPCRTSVSPSCSTCCSTSPRTQRHGRRRRVGAQTDDDFSAFVFKVQSGMNNAHRDRLAYARVVSGTFERGMVVTHATTGRPFATKFAQSVFGRDTAAVESAEPGDIIGFVNAQALRVGDTVFVGDPIEYPPVPSFAPEHFVTASAGDISRYKQFRRGIEQLDQEGVVQVLRSDLRGDQNPVLAAVGPMQFEVVEDRMTNEFNSPIRFSRLDYQVARRTDAAGAAASPASAASRCSSAATAPAWPCSSTSGAPRSPPATTPTSCSRPCPPAAAERLPSPPGAYRREGDLGTHPDPRPRRPLRARAARARPAVAGRRHPGAAAARPQRAARRRARPRPRVAARRRRRAAHRHPRPRGGDAGRAGLRRPASRRLLAATRRRTRPAARRARRRLRPPARPAPQGLGPYAVLPRR